MGKYSTISTSLILLALLSGLTIVTIEEYPVLSVILFALCHLFALVCFIIAYIEVKSWKDKLSLDDTEKQTKRQL